MTPTAVTTSRLVGMAFVNSSSQFVDSSGSRGLLNFFNRRRIASYSPVTGQTASTSYALIGNTVIFLAWADEAVSAVIAGYANNNTASSAENTINYVDAAFSGYSSVSFTAGGQGAINAVVPPATLAEGLHTAAPYGQVSQGTGTWSGVQIIETRG